MSNTCHSAASTVESYNVYGEDSDCVDVLSNSTSPPSQDTRATSEAGADSDDLFSGRGVATIESTDIPSRS